MRSFTIKFSLKYIFIKLFGLFTGKETQKPLNKQEVIHEHDREDDEGDFEESDDDDLGEVFGHKKKLRTKKTTGIMSRHKKKISVNELAVNVDGPIKFTGGSLTNIQYQRMPQSATQPQIKGLSFPQNVSMSTKEISGFNQ